MRLLNLIRDALDFFRPLNRLDFGEFGVMFRDGDGNMVPMDQADMDDLKFGVERDISAFWLIEESKAVALYGEAILKPQ